MKMKRSRIFWGITLFLVAAALIAYGLGFGAPFFGVPLYKLFLGLLLVVWTIRGLLFYRSYAHQLIFLRLALLFMLFESEIALWCSLANSNIINNWLLTGAALVADIALGLLVPARKYGPKHTESVSREGAFRNTFSSATHYVDAAACRYSYVRNKMGETQVYYQNADMADPSVSLELEIKNTMGEVVVHIPADWVVENKMNCVMGEIAVRSNTGNGITLILTGSNTMGEVAVRS